MEFIQVIENALPTDLCDALKDFIDTYADSMGCITEYGKGENTQTQKLIMDANPFILSHAKYHVEKKNLLNTVRDVLNGIIGSRLVHLMPTSPDGWKGGEEVGGFRFSSFQLRKVLGDTRKHIDDVCPELILQQNVIYVRTGTIIVTLTDSSDTLHFPCQNTSIPLTKGSLVFFPSFWMYPHYSSSSQRATTSSDGKITRYSLQTWTLQEFHATTVSDYDII